MATLKKLREKLGIKNKLIASTIAIAIGSQAIMNPSTGDLTDLLFVSLFAFLIGIAAYASIYTLIKPQKAAYQYARVYVKKRARRTRDR